MLGGMLGGILGGIMGGIVGSGNDSFGDDSGMMLCLADSLAERKTLDRADVMEKFIAWRTISHDRGPERSRFDDRRTIDGAIARYRHKTSADDAWSFGGRDDMDAGHGGIVRLAPVPIFYWDDLELAIAMARQSSGLTHARPECLDAATLMAFVMVKLLRGYTKEEALDADVVEHSCTVPEIKALCRGEYKSKTRDLLSVEGGVVDSLEAALWGLHTAASYEGGVRALADLGDAVCCVYGQMAGALYGLEGMPQTWVDAVRQRDTIVRVSYSLVQAALE